MKTVIALVAIAFVAFAIAQPIRPHISETFEGEGYTHVVTSNETVWGLGRWVIDEPAGHGLEYWEFTGEHRHHSVHFLRRFDLGFDYAITFERYPSPHAHCRKHAVTPPMPPVWAWTREARYHGKHVIDGTTFDLWGHHHGGVDLEVAVSEHDASRPHYFTRRSPSEHRVYHLISWATFKPNSTWFNVPDICKNATETVGVSGPIVDGDDSLLATCGVAAAHAESVATQSNGMSGVAMVQAAFNKAGIYVPDTLVGGPCLGGARVGDVFVDGSSAAVYLGADRFAECPKAGECTITGWRDFDGFCRRFC